MVSGALKSDLNLQDSGGYLIPIFLYFALIPAVVANNLYPKYSIYKTYLLG